MPSTDDAELKRCKVTSFFFHTQTIHDFFTRGSAQTRAKPCAKAKGNGTEDLVLSLDPFPHLTQSLINIFVNSQWPVDTAALGR